MLLICCIQAGSSSGVFFGRCRGAGRPPDASGCISCSITIPDCARRSAACLNIRRGGAATFKAYETKRHGEDYQYIPHQRPL
jgi:hypothetical protein